MNIKKVHKQQTYSVIQLIQVILHQNLKEDIFLIKVDKGNFLGKKWGDWI